MYLKKGEKKKFFSIYFLPRRKINLVLKSKICKNRRIVGEKNFGTKICLKVKRLKDLKKGNYGVFKNIYLINRVEKRKRLEKKMRQNIIICTPN